jgi:hypothetical protein
VEDSFTYLRQFAPEVIKTLEFRGSDGSADLLTAIDMLRKLYVSGGRNVPAGAPTSFVPARWKGYLSAAEEDKDTICRPDHDPDADRGVGAGPRRVLRPGRCARDRG